MILLRLPALYLLKAYIKLKYKIVIYNNVSLDQCKAPFILISNHSSVWDSVIYKCCLGIDFYICGAKEKYFSNWMRVLIMKMGKVIRVTTENKYIDDCVSLLKSQHNILIYPEMGRNPVLKPFVKWGAEVAIRSGIAVIPMKINGTAARPFKKIEVHIGDSIAYDPLLSVDDLNNVFYRKINSL